MVWEMEQHAPGAVESGGRLSPISLLHLRFALALIASMFLIFISLTLHFEAGQAPTFLRLMSLLLATGVMLLLAGPFLDNLRRELSDRRLSLASLIFAGSGAAYLLSAWSTISAGLSGLAAPVGPDAGATYFETSAMILTFYIGSLLIDTRIKRGMAAYTRLWQTETAPEVLRIVDGDVGGCGNDIGKGDGGIGADGSSDSGSGSEGYADRGDGGETGWEGPNLRTVRTSIANLAEGERFLAEAGHPVLADSVVAGGAGLVDEAHLTGEPDPVRKRPGERVTAGSVSMDGGLVLEVVRPYSESTLQDYLRRARAMRSRPGYYERVAAKGASVLLAFVTVAAFAGLAWHTWNAGLPFALQVFLSVLLIGCPCAFSISTPAALWVANQRLHRSGVVAMGGSQALEKLSGTRVVLFDKTGTLTEGVAFRSMERVTDDPAWPVDRLMRMAGGLEMDQVHPFARALRRYLDQHGLDPVWPAEARLLSGQGMEGWFGEGDVPPVNSAAGAGPHAPSTSKTRRVLLVNNSHPEATGKLDDSDLGLFLDGRLMLRLRLYQPPRRHLADVIRRLREHSGLEVAVVTGDPSDASPEFTDVPYHKGCSPERKAELVEEYRRRFGAVMFVGDGTNDLMAINRADLGVGVYTGTMSIRNHADFVLFHPNLNVVPEMLDFSGRITGTIRINFFWAVAYNFVGIGVALMGLLHPFFAIAAMMLSSLFVTFHSASLQRRQPLLGELEKQVNLVTGEPLLRPGVSET
jgi:cation transport ATPase